MLSIAIPYPLPDLKDARQLMMAKDTMRVETVCYSVLVPGNHLSLSIARSKDARGMGRHGWFLPATGVLATIIQLKPEILTSSIINDAIIIMAVVAVLVHVVCSAFEDILEAGHFKSIAAGTGRLARALAITLLLIICIPKIWWFLLSAWVLFFIWVTYTLREELSKLCESLYNAVRLRHGQEPNELPV